MELAARLIDQMKISGLVITYNEELYIEKCIQSLLCVCDEVIVVDSYSTDQTPEICKQLGVTFISHPYAGQIEQKNFALNQAKYEYILALDGDEVMSQELINSILKIKSHGKAQIGYEINRLTNYAGQWIRYGGWYPDWKLRLWKKSEGQWQGKNPHDQVILRNGQKPEKLQGHLLHYAFDSVNEHVLRIENYAQIGAQSAFDSGKRSSILLIVLSPIWKFVRDYFLKAGFMDGFLGFHIAILSAKSKFLKYEKLYKLQRLQK